MSRTVRTPHPFRTGRSRMHRCRTDRSRMDLVRAAVGGAAAVVLLAACGGGDSDADAATTPAASQGGETAAADGAADFCAQAAGIDERVDAALSDDGNDPSLAEAFRRIAVDLRGIEPPDAIAADWTALAAGLDRMADAFGQVDVTDLGSLEALEQAEDGMTEAGDRVDEYLGDECGI
jgi:ABC-type glycerol-3-phosphate transport system substrate-binding protein